MTDSDENFEVVELNTNASARTDRAETSQQNKSKRQKTGDETEIESNRKLNSK